MAVHSWIGSCFLCCSGRGSERYRFVSKKSKDSEMIFSPFYKIQFLILLSSPPDNTRRCRWGCYLIPTQYWVDPVPSIVIVVLFLLQGHPQSQANWIESRCLQIKWFKIVGRCSSLTWNNINRFDFLPFLPLDPSVPVVLRPEICASTCSSSSSSRGPGLLHPLPALG